MNDKDQKQLGKTLWAIADQLRGAMNAEDFRDYLKSARHEISGQWGFRQSGPTCGLDAASLSYATFFRGCPHEQQRRARQVFGVF